eukprot:SM000225S07025  [mRNA]  locus=s225:127495:130069:+ [translate_table: standard]
MRRFVDLLARRSGANGTCIEIGNGAHDSWVMRLDKQIRADPLLKDGFNLVGLSQGNLIGRAYIELCDGGPPVHNFVSLGGPHAGTASTPLCLFKRICKFIDALLAFGIYSAYVQDHVAPTGYVKIPTVSFSDRFLLPPLPSHRCFPTVDLPAYLRGCVFLPVINNERPLMRNETYRERFSSLNHLVLVKFEDDSVIIPPETAWFGYYAPNSLDKVLNFEQTDLYLEDWIGLRKLHEARRVTLVAAPGNHLAISNKLIKKHIIPYLRLRQGDQPFTTAPISQ